jgi:hypothetical protein
MPVVIQLEPNLLRIIDASIPPASCRWCFNFNLPAAHHWCVDTTGFMPVVLQLQPKPAAHHWCLDTTGFTPVVIQLQPKLAHHWGLDTTGFTPVVLQLQPKTAAHHWCLDTTGFMPVVIQLQPKPAAHHWGVDTTGFTPVVLQLQPNLLRIIEASIPPASRRWCFNFNLPAAHAWGLLSLERVSGLSAFQRFVFWQLRNDNWWSKRFVDRTFLRDLFQASSLLCGKISGETNWVFDAMNISVHLLKTFLTVPGVDPILT